jgi:hypothetical protein
MIEWVDSHYCHVKERVTSKNSTRKFSGVMDAEGWPPKVVDMEAFYLITLGHAPAARTVISAANNMYRTTVQWTWMVAGTDIERDFAGVNRGDRYRRHGKMVKELLNGAYPLFTEKKSFDMDSTGKLIKASFDPKQFIYWSVLEFTQRNDRESGLVYGIATTYLTGVATYIAE